MLISPAFCHDKSLWGEKETCFMIFYNYTKSNDSFVSYQDAGLIRYHCVLTAPIKEKIKQTNSLGEKILTNAKFMNLLLIHTCCESSRVRETQ